MRNLALKQDRGKGRSPLSALAPHHFHGQTFLHTWMHIWHHIGQSSKSPKKNWFTMCGYPAGSLTLSFHTAPFYDIYRTGICSQCVKLSNASPSCCSQSFLKFPIDKRKWTLNPSHRYSHRFKLPIIPNYSFSALALLMKSNHIIPMNNSF